MDKAGSWLRQARHRAKKRGVPNSLDLEHVAVILAHYEEKCAYCDSAELHSLDHPFPLKEDAPNVPANCVPTCKKCKDLKKSRNLPEMYSDGDLAEDRYISLMSKMLALPDGDILKEHVKKVTGL